MECIDQFVLVWNSFSDLNCDSDWTPQYRLTVTLSDGLLQHVGFFIIHLRYVAEDHIWTNFKLTGPDQVFYDTSSLSHR